MRIDDDLQVNDNLDVRGFITDENSTNVTISDGLNVTNDTTIGSDGSGSLTVNGNVTADGVTMGSGNITYDSKFFISGGAVRITGNIEHDGNGRLGSDHWPACITFKTNDDNETGDELCACMSGGNACDVGTSNRDFTMPGTYSCRAQFDGDGMPRNCDERFSNQNVMCCRDF